MKLLKAEGTENLYRIADDQGRSCVDQDAIRFGLSKHRKRQLMKILIMLANGLICSGKKSLLEYEKKTLIKKIDKNERAIKHNLYEVRSSAHGGRLFFVLNNSSIIVVSAVDKQISKDKFAQSKAINRGRNR